MAFTQDLDTKVYTYPEDARHRAVGWLSIAQPFNEAEPEPEFLSRLKECVSFDTMQYRYDPLTCAAHSFFGLHICELCNSIRGSGSLFLPGEKVIYIAPQMVYHYVKDHHYVPPDDFVAAVVNAPPVSSIAYRDKIWDIAGLTQEDFSFGPEPNASEQA